MEIEFGNAGDLNTNGTGWFIGFSDWSKSDASSLRHIPADLAATGLCVKWFLHEAGHPNGQAKPISYGRTISMLVGEPGQFRIEFSPTPAFEPRETISHLLSRPGDFAIWGQGIYHRSYALQKACIVSIRWTPQT